MVARDGDLLRPRCKSNHQIMRPLPPLPDWVALEHQVAQLMSKQEAHGWCFDERAAWQLASALQKELEETKKVLRERHPFVQGATFNPKRNNKSQGYFQGCESIRLKELNPTSRDHIAWILQTHHGWKPTQLTATGKPIIDEIVLKEIVASGGPVSYTHLTLPTNREV